MTATCVLLACNAALQVASASKVLTADSVQTANAVIGSSELIEANEKAVNDIYLATTGKDVDGFTGTQAADLFAIANQCPMLGGNAVFKARSLYWLIDDSYAFDDQLICLPFGIVVKNVVEQQANAVSIVPNPANDEATLVLDQPLDEPGFFVAYNAMAKEVMRLTVPAETTRVVFSTSGLAPTVYQYRVQSRTGAIGNGKLTIVR